MKLTLKTPHNFYGEPRRRKQNFGTLGEEGAYGQEEKGGEKCEFSSAPPPIYRVWKSCEIT